VPPRAFAADDDGAKPLLDTFMRNPQYAVHADPALASPDLKDSSPPLTAPSICEMQGALLKHVGEDGLGRLTAAAAVVMAAEWHERYFVLSGGCLLWWHSIGDYQEYMQGHDPSDPKGEALLKAAHALAPSTSAAASGSSRVSTMFQSHRQPHAFALSGCEVIIDLYDPHHGITLKSPSVGAKVIKLRANNETARSRWTQSLVAVTKWAAAQQP